MDLLLIWTSSKMLLIWTSSSSVMCLSWADPEGGPGVRTPPPPGILAKMCLSDS